MLCKLPRRSKNFAARLPFCVPFLFALIPQSSAQTVPPLDVPLNNPSARDPDAIAIDGWQLYPTLRLYSLYSDNLFQSPQSPISVPGIGIAPSLTAVWTNGIHTTTLYGNIDRQAYPTDNAVNTIDGRTGFTEKYEAMRDLIFTVNGNYAHTTWSTGLQNSIQTPAAAPATTVLPNGNTVLPNGTILSPTGQPTGQVNVASGSSIPLVVNPFNQYTGTFTIDKIFNRGIMSLSASIGRTNFDNQSIQPDFTSRTLTENAAFWLGPLIYAYSNGSVGTVATDATFGSATALSVTSTPSRTTTSYRVVGGLGTRPLELFSGSVYIGHQGSEVDGSTAGGYVYGGALTYNPTTTWTLTGTLDRTTNIASQTSSSTNLALTLPGLTAVQVSIGSSTQVTSAGLRSSYEITPQWFANCQLAYSRIEYIDSSRLDNSWVLDATLRYDIWRNLSITWEYRFTSLLSNAPLTSLTSNYGVMGATYKF
ncbi:outer membrane beta-barrel protein [Bradyrhizobium sp. LTSPM299]|uniref:outer membrane beta-barrel protein n=1 Tax=Bradyrhizobium sp. LTSPM299 TaxID=1619233 RepID=UPI0009E27197|nr:outer membrane beta-barrel protein [Bradyrhizobium sp. LTSPM299]